MQGTTVTEDISPGCTANADIPRLYALWQKKQRAAGLPSLAKFDVEKLWCCNDLMLVEQKAPDVFEYLRYGTNIVRASGFDMTGKRTSDFHSDTGRFFTQCYRRCVEECRGLYTTNRAAHAALVTGWERLLLPLCDDDGTPRYVLGYNRPLAFRHELLAHVLDATRDIIIAVEQTPSDDAAAPDCVVLSINAAAEQLLRCARADAVGQRISALLPQWRTLAWGPALAESFRSALPAQLEWHRAENGNEWWYRVAIDPFSEGTVIAMSDITVLKEKEHILGQLNSDLEQLANTDPLTGMSNRRHFLAVAQAEAQRTKRYAAPLSIIAIDVDQFKPLNDRFGHEAGDAALIAIVNLLSRELRSNDTLGRLGGDEFFILLPHTGEAEAYRLARRLCADLAAQRFCLGAASARLTCSFGVAERMSDDDDVSALVQRADRALYRAKELGRNRVERASGSGHERSFVAES